MTMIGADLGAMSVLSRRFESAGGEFQTQSASIARGVDAALAEFTAEMRALDAEARGLADEIAAEMTRLNNQAASTMWTGANRTRMDGLVAALDDEIVAIKSSIEAFMAEASSVVNGSFTATMNTLRTNVEASGTNAQTIATSFSTSVEGQRSAFDTVMNG